MKKNLKLLAWLEIILGICILVSGVVALFNPSVTIIGIIVLLALIFIFVGINDLISAFSSGIKGNSKWLMIATGIIAIIIGILFSTNIASGVLLLSVLFPLWLLFNSFSKIFSLNHFQDYLSKSVYNISIVMAIVGIIVSILMFLDPYYSIVSISLLSSIYIIFLGLLKAISGFNTLSFLNKYK